jgi:hypothetical protein
LEPILEAHIEVQQRALDALKEFLQVVPDTIDFELDSPTRRAALWSLSSRSVSLGMAFVLQVAAGFGVESMPTARAIHETNRLIMAFVLPGRDDAMLRRWLEGVQPKPSTVHSALRKIYQSGLDETSEGGLSRADVVEAYAMERQLYKSLSEGGHTHRDSLRDSMSFDRHLMIVGPAPDWDVRAYHVSWADGVIGEIVRTVGYELVFALGHDLGEQAVNGIFEWLDEVERTHPIPDDMMRAVPE